MNKHSLISTPFLVVFIGPQGAGKTTQARLLLRYVRCFYKGRVMLVRLTHYTMPQRLFFLIAKQWGRTRVKFYEDEPFTEAPSPRLLKTLFPLLLVFHLVSLIMSNALLNVIYMLFHVSLIEDDGYVFKQLVDILYTARYCGVTTRKRSISNHILNIIKRKMYSIVRQCNVIYLRIFNQDSLRKRYILEHRRHIEPANYIIFQTAIYDILLNYAKRNSVIVDASEDPNLIHQIIIKKFLPQRVHR